MSIIRKKKQNNFSVVPNAPFDDNKLSWKAKGILAYLLTKPDNWQLQIKNLVSKSTDGRDSTTNGVKELIEHRYIIKTTERNEAGQFITTYDVFETPQQETRNGLAVTENPKRVSRNGLTVTENPTLINTDIVNTKEVNTKEVNIERVKGTHTQKKTNFKKPSLDVLSIFMLSYSKDKGFGFNENDVDNFAQDFLDHYDSNGWMIGKNKMKDWKATAQRWIRQNHKEKNTKTQNKPYYGKKKNLLGTPEGQDTSQIDYSKF